MDGRTVWDDFGSGEGASDISHSDIGAVLLRRDGYGEDDGKQHLDEHIAGL